MKSKTREFPRRSCFSLIYKKNEYETPFKGLCENTQTYTNRILTLKMGAIIDKIIICYILPYKTEAFP